MVRLDRLFIVLILVSGLGAAPALGADDDLRLGMLSGIEERLEQAVDPRTIDRLAELSRFYEGRDWTPLWIEEGAPSDRARATAALIAKADQHGLDPDDYGAPAIAALLGSPQSDLLAQLEVRLSIGFLDLAADLSTGRLEPSRLDPELFIEPRPVDRLGLLFALSAGAEPKALLAALVPKRKTYAGLRRALARYRAIVEAGGWPAVPEGPTLDPGMRDQRVAALRERLAASGDLTGLPAEDPLLYDGDLQKAVEAFQARHGLAVDGRIGPNTLEALNVPALTRVQQIILNLERQRWMPPDPDRVLRVNLADFRLQILEAGTPIFESDVVIGTPYDRTPVFSEDMTYLEVNPYWNVPESIAREELLPKIIADPAYLAQNNYEIVAGWQADAPVIDPARVDWTAVTPKNFPYRLRQKPGQNNALGQVKFMLPNRFSIYLHDTPAKALFQRTQRSFSHGCIRVARPFDMAHLILGFNEEMSAAAFDEAVASGERRIVTLARPLPVQITYLTAWVDRSETVHFRRDVYDRDAVLAAALLGPRASPEARY